MTNRFSKKTKKLAAGASAAMVSFFASLPVFAADGDLEGVITGAITKARTLIATIFDPLCVVALGICIVTLVLGRNSKSADSSMSWAKRIIICFVIFNILGTILAWMGSAFDGASGFENALN